MSQKKKFNLSKLFEVPVEWWGSLNFYMKLGTILIVAILFYFLSSLGMDYADYKRAEKFKKEREELIIQIEKLKTESELKEIEIDRLTSEREMIKERIMEAEKKVPKKRDKPASFEEIDQFFDSRGF